MSCTTDMKGYRVLMYRRSIYFLSKPIETLERQSTTACVTQLANWKSHVVGFTLHQLILIFVVELFSNYSRSKSSCSCLLGKFSELWKSPYKGSLVKFSFNVACFYTMNHTCILLLNVWQEKKREQWSSVLLIFYGETRIYILFLPNNN